MAENGREPNPEQKEIQARDDTGSKDCHDVDDVEEGLLVGLG